MFVLFLKRVCAPLANSLFHHRPDETLKPTSKVEAAYHNGRLGNSTHSRSADRLNLSEMHGPRNGVVLFNDDLQKHFAAALPWALRHDGEPVPPHRLGNANQVRLETPPA
jgi:hypothetical protein